MPRTARSRLEARSTGQAGSLSYGAAALLLLLAGGCGSEPAQTRHPVESRLFSHVEIIGAHGHGAGQFNKPRSLELDRDDNLFVVDMTGRVQKFSPRGEFLQLWQMPETDLGRAKGMGRDQAGRIVVLEPHYQRVNHFTPDGRLAEQWGRHGTNAGELTLPRDVVVTSRGDVFVSEYTLVDRVQGFSAANRQGFVSFGRAGDGPGEFNRAEGLGIDAQDRLYVADSCNHRVQMFTAEGRWLLTYGRPGRASGEMSYPYDVTVDAAGRQYVCEFGNSRIQVFDAQQKVVEILGAPGNRPGRFNNPWCVSLDSQGNLYVADSGNHRVQKFVRGKEAVSGGDRRGLVRDWSLMQRPKSEERNALALEAGQ